MARVPLLETYEQMRAAAAKIRRAVQSRDMPPWGADNTGLCRKWKGALWLTDHELQTIAKWTDGDRPAGEPAKAPAPPAPPRFEKNGPTLDMGVDYRPGIGPLAYRCFVVDPELDRDRLSEARSVAQITLYALTSASLAGAEHRVSVSSDITAGYAPSRPFSPGDANRLPSGAPAVVVVERRGVDHAKVEPALDEVPFNDGGASTRDAICDFGALRHVEVAGAEGEAHLAHAAAVPLAQVVRGSDVNCSIQGRLWFHLGSAGLISIMLVNPDVQLGSSAAGSRHDKAHEQDAALEHAGARQHGFFAWRPGGHGGAHSSGWHAAGVNALRAGPP